MGESAAAGALDAAADAAHTPANDVGWASKASAAGALFVESLMGIAIPLVLQSLSGNAQWWLSLLNCFSGGVFLAAGLVHLLPHCQEAQEALGSAAASYPPLYLVLITLGYFLVLFAVRGLDGAAGCVPAWGRGQGCPGRLLAAGGPCPALSLICDGHSTPTSARPCRSECCLTCTAAATATLAARTRASATATRRTAATMATAIPTHMHTAWAQRRTSTAAHATAMTTPTMRMARTWRLLAATMHQGCSSRCWWGVRLSRLATWQRRACC